MARICASQPVCTHAICTRCHSGLYDQCNRASSATLWFWLWLWGELAWHLNPPPRRSPPTAIPSYPSAGPSQSAVRAANQARICPAPIGAWSGRRGPVSRTRNARGLPVGVGNMGQVCVCSHFTNMSSSRLTHRPSTVFFFPCIALVLSPAILWFRQFSVIASASCSAVLAFESSHATILTTFLYTHS